MANGVRFNENYPVIEKSQQLWAKAAQRIPSGTQTLGKGPTQFTRGVSPIFLEKGKGSHVWDVDGNEYIDFNMALGPVSLGYCYEKVDEAIRGQLEKGITFTLMHPLEVEVADLIASVIPGAEMVRFSKTGADMTTAAVRLSRAHTGRDKVLCCGYHGWHDWYIGTTTRSRGVPQAVKDLTQSFSYNDIASLEALIDDKTACVILEPMLFAEPTDDFLFKVRDLCNRHGALLIFDEMWTGFRMGLGGAQQCFDVQADLATFSKAVANGMPLSILTGRKDVMKLWDEDMFFYTTFGGEALSLAAAKATIEEIKDKDVCGYLDTLGNRLIEGVRKVIKDENIDFVGMAGRGCRSVLTIDPKAGNPLETKAFIQQELIKRGVLWAGMHALSFSHTESDIDYVISVYREVLPMFKSAVESGDMRAQLKGQPLEPVFRTVTGKSN